MNELPTAKHQEYLSLKKISFFLPLGNGKSQCPGWIQAAGPWAWAGGGQPVLPGSLPTCPLWSCTTCPQAQESSLSATQTHAAKGSAWLCISTDHLQGALRGVTLNPTRKAGKGRELSGQVHSPTWPIPCGFISHLFPEQLRVQGAGWGPKGWDSDAATSQGTWFWPLLSHWLRK